MEIFSTVTLAISGLLLFSVGMMRLSNPIKTYLKNSGITLNNDVDLLNEMRGVSSVMLFGGVIMLLGTFISMLTVTSHFVAILILLGFAVGRMVSISADGKPNKQIMQGIMSELILGAANAFALVYLLG